MAKDFMSKYVKQGSSKVKPIAQKSGTWITNALKSVGYSSFDILSDMMPATIDVAKTTATVGVDLANTLKQTRTSDRSLKNTLNKNFYFNLGKDVLKNSLEDLKSGKFYNKDRTDQYFASMNDDLGDFDFDMNFGDDENFDMDEFDDSIDSADGMSHASFSRKKNGSNEFTNIVVGTDLGPDSAIVKATEYQTETSVNVGRAVIDNSRVNTRATMTMIGAFRNEVNASLVSMSDNISSITGVVTDSLGKHISLSAKYYEDSISLQTQILEQLRTQSTPVVDATNTNTKKFKDYNNILDLLSGDGALDLNAYKALVKKQANNYVDNNMVLSQLKFMNDNRDSLQMIALSPFQRALETTIKGVIPKAMQNAMTAFDNQLKETTVAALNQVSGLQRSNNPLLSAIGSIFGLQNKITASTIDKSAYHKGAMAWSGTDHQALTNVIPTLLRKIYASVSGTQEIDFDYDKGVFRKVKDMEGDFARDKLYRETSNFGDYKSSFKEFIDKNAAASKEEKEKFNKDFETFISKLVRDSSGGRTFRLGGRNGNKENYDDIRDLLGASSSDDSSVKAIRAFFESLSEKDKAAVTAFFGRNVQEQRASLDRTIREMQADPLKYGTKYMATGLEGENKTDAHLKFENGTSKVIGVKGGLASSMSDEYGKSSVQYLREILNTLTTGIYVVPISDVGIGGRRGRRRGGNSSNSDILTSINDRRKETINNLKNAKKKYEPTTRTNGFSDEDRQRAVTERGLIDFNSDVNQDGVTAVAVGEANAENTQMNEEDKTLIGKIIGKLPQDSGLASILNNIRNGANKAGEAGTGLFNKLNNALFEVVFGSGKDERKGAAAIFNRAMGVLRSGFTSFATFLDNKIFKPLDNALFGENGFIKKLKESDFGKKVSETFNNIKTKTSDFLLGTKVGDKREGGIFSETANSLKDIGNNIKTAILGEKGPDGKPLPLEQDNSVLGNIKKMTKRISTNISDSLGIEKSDESIGTRLSNTIDSAFHRISERANDWSNNIFGKKDKDGNYVNDVFNSEFASQFKKDMGENKGFIGATTSIGLLSSLFMPFGPIGGALLGAGTGIISKSNGLKDLLFGELDEGTNERAGGIINKEFQDFFKKHKTGMALGAVGGVVSSFGLLPSFFFPGGPIGGALVGTGISLIAKSDAFNTLMYGEGGTKDDPTGGLMNNFKKVFGENKDFKKVGLDAGIGAGVGLLGSFFLPGGPLLNALLGSAISVGTATDKFRNWFFGEEGADGKRTGGIFNRFTGFMKEKIFNPLSTSVKLAQSHILEFVEENMVLPFKYALEPLKKEASHAKDIVKEKISNVFESLKTSLNKNVVKPIGETLDKYLISPIKKTLTNLFSGLGKVIGGIISAPFKMMGAMGWSAYDDQRKRGKEDYIKNSGRGFLGRLGMRFGFVDKEGVNASQYSDKGASYEAGKNVERRARYEQEIANIKRKREEERYAIRNGLNVSVSRNATRGTKPSTTQTSRTTAQSVQSTSSGSTRVNTKTPATLSNSQRRAYKNAYKEGYAAGFRGEELRQYVETFKEGRDPSEGVSRVGSTESADTKASGSSSKQSKSKTKREKTKSLDNKTDTGSTKVNTKSSFKPESSSSSTGSTKDTGKNIQLIQKDVSKISDSVYGQLNGVGSNVNKIYRLLLKRFGKKDEDIKGNNNKEYVGFWGKIRTALNNPIDRIKDIITTPFKKIGEFTTGLVVKIKGFGGKIVNAGKELIINIGKAGKAILSGIGSIIKGIGEMAVDIVHTGLSAVRAILPAIGETLKTAVGLLGDGLKAAGSLLVTSVKTIGETIAGAARGIGQLLGGAMSGLGSLLSAAGLIGKDIIKGLWTGLKAVGKGVFNVGKNVIKAPFKLLDSLIGKGKGFGLFGRGPFHVIVDSGTLDKVKKVKVVELVKSIGEKVEDKTQELKSNISGNRKKPKNKPENTQTAVDTNAGLPLNLQFFGERKDGNTSVLTKLKDKMSKSKDKLKDFGTSIRNKLKRKDDAEKEEQVKRGSRESILSRFANADKDKEESAWKSKIASLLTRSTEASEGHFKSFFDTFDLKKGLITAGIIALAPFVIKLFKKFDIGGLLTSMVNGIQLGLNEIGGLLGLVNNGTEAVDNAKDVVNGTDTHYAIDESGNLIYDENGRPVKEITKGSRVKQLLTPTKTRINTESGKWEQQNNWTGKSDAIVNFTANRAVGVAKKGVNAYKTGKKFVNAIGKSGAAIKKFGKKVFDEATLRSDTLTKAYIVTDDLVKAGKTKAATTFNAAKGAIKAGGKKIAESDGILGKAIKMMNQALDFLVKKFTALGSRFGVKIGEGAIGKVLKNVRGILKVSKLKPLIDKITQFVASITSKVSASTSTLLIAEIGFALYGAVDGACNAGGLFEVNPKDVDAKMRAIAGVFKSLLNTSVGSWVDLVNSIVYELLGFNFVKTVASHVYKLLSNDEGDAKLDSAQQKFTEEYEASVQAEYQAYVESTTAQGQTPMSFEDFKASSLVTTRSEYNSKVNKSLMGRMVSGAQKLGKGIANSKVVKAVGTRVKTTTNAIANSKFVQGAKDKIGGVVSKGKETLTGVLNKGKEVFSGLGDATMKLIKDGLSAGKGLIKGFANIVETYRNKDNDFLTYLKADVNPVDEDNMFHGLLSGVLNISKVVLLPKLIIGGIFVKIGKAIGKFLVGAKNAVVDYAKNATALSVLAVKGDFAGLSNYKYETDENNPISGITGAAVGITRIMYYPVTAISFVGQTVVKGIGKFLVGAKNAVVDYAKNATALSVLAVKGDFAGLGNYKYETDENNPISGITSAAVGVTRIMYYPVTAISHVVQKVAGGVGKFLVGAKNAVVDYAKNATALSVLAVKGDIKGLSAYNYEEDENNPISGITSAAVGVTKFMYYPAAFISSSVISVGKFFKDKFDKVVDYGKSTVEFVTRLNSYTDTNKSLEGWENESMSVGEDDVVGGVVSSVVKNVMWAYVGFIRAIKGLGGWLKDVAGKVVDKGKDIANGVGTFFMDLGRGGNDGGRPIGGRGGNSDTLNGMPYYSQNDPKYKNKPYRGIGGRGNEDTIGESGCGPTAMAMVASKLTGRNYNPVTMAKMAEAGGYSSSVGTTPGYFSATANTLGIPNQRLNPTGENVIGSLANGNPVILQGKRSGKVNSPYTSEGHYVTATGFDGNNIIINDPRGREYSGAYRTSDVLTDTVGMWSFGGKSGSSDNIYTKRGKLGGFGANNTKDFEKWLNIVREVKKAIASQKPGYSQSNWIDITVGGKTIKVRTDCSGYVAACLKFFGVMPESANLTSPMTANPTNATMTATGFTPGGWSGWENLKAGDILGVNGHTEIFAYNKDGKHYVYNCGSTASVNSPVPTVTGHSSYQTVWRCGPAGTGVVTGPATLSGPISTGTDIATDSTGNSGGVSSFSELLSGAANAISNSIMKDLGFKVDDSSSSGSSNTYIDGSVDNSSLQASSVNTSANAKKIWDFFKSKGLTNAGIAGMMGNMQIESGLNPMNLQNSYEKSLGFTDSSYTNAVDKGAYNNFARDSAGYGLVQWTYHTLKQQLLDYKNQTGKSIGDLGMQLEFLAKQLQGSYAGVWNTLKTTSNIKDASDTFMLNFERPHDQSSKARNTRASAGKAFYDTYAGKGGNDGGHPITSSYETLGGYGRDNKVTTSSYAMQDTKSKAISDIISSNNTIKSMTSEETSHLLNVMIGYLSQIVDNTGATSSELETLNSKDFGSSKITSNTVNNTNNSYANNSTANSSSKAADRSKYSMAQRVAAGILT